MSILKNILCFRISYISVLAYYIHWRVGSVWFHVPKNTLPFMEFSGGGVTWSNRASSRRTIAACPAQIATALFIVTTSSGFHCIHPQNCSLFTSTNIHFSSNNPFKSAHIRILYQQNYLLNLMVYGREKKPSTNTYNCVAGELLLMRWN